MCMSQCFLTLVVVPALFFITALIRVNSFHNLSHWVSHALHVFFFLWLFLFLFLIISVYSCVPYDLLVSYAHTELSQEAEKIALVLWYFLKEGLYLNEPKWFSIYLHAPTQLSNTYSTYFHTKCFYFIQCLLITVSIWLCIKVDFQPARCHFYQQLMARGPGVLLAVAPVMM